jgi:hypothetical protein
MIKRTSFPFRILLSIYSSVVMTDENDYSKYNFIYFAVSSSQNVEENRILLFHLTKDFFSTRSSDYYHL